MAGYYNIILFTVFPTAIRTGPAAPDPFSVCQTLQHLDLKTKRRVGADSGDHCLDLLVFSDLLTSCLRDRRCNMLGAVGVGLDHGHGRHDAEKRCSENSVKQGSCGTAALRKQNAGW